MVKRYSEEDITYALLLVSSYAEIFERARQGCFTSYNIL